MRHVLICEAQDHCNKSPMCWQARQAARDWCERTTHCCLTRLLTFCSLDQCITLLWWTGDSVCTICPFSSVPGLGCTVFDCGSIAMSEYTLTAPHALHNAHLLSQCNRMQVQIISAALFTAQLTSRGLGLLHCLTVQALRF